MGKNCMFHIFIISSHINQQWTEWSLVPWNCSLNHLKSVRDSYFSTALWSRKSLLLFCCSLHLQRRRTPTPASIMSPMLYIPTHSCTVKLVMEVAPYIKFRYIKRNLRWMFNNCIISINLILVFYIKFKINKTPSFKIL